MKIKPCNPHRTAAILAAIVLTVFALPLVSHAQSEPALIIRHVGGESSVYFLPGLEQLTFVGDTLIVMSDGGVDTYPAETIDRIEFNLEFSGIEDPEKAAALLKAVHLFQNQPNPFSPETQISFELPQAGEVELAIYSPDGRLVRALLAGERRAGRHTARWDGLDDAGRAAPGGVYFYRLRVPGIEESRRMILLP